MSNYGYIYLIENLLNNKVYVGQTVINIEKRFKEHLYAARNNKNYLLSKAIRKYKEENFSIKVIDTAQTKEQLDSLEIFYIKKYNSFYEDGYNMTKGGSGNSIETRKVISINDLKIFDSARLTAEFYELQESSIIACCNRRPKNNYCGKMSNGDVHIF